MAHLYNRDCLEVMPLLEAGSIDAIITDLPYGTTACEWDSIIPLAPMWEQVKRVLKANGVFVTTSAQPFTSVLVCSNLEWFKYEWNWNKRRAFGVLHAKNMPLKKHENILVFSAGVVAHENLSDNRMTYNPQMGIGKPYKKLVTKSQRQGEHAMDRPSLKDKLIVNDGYRYPDTVLDFDNNNSGSLHPTQKPVDLYEYLIRTYTNPSETVLDICMGSGTTGVAAVQTGREFIGIEKEHKYFVIAEKRIGSAHPPLFTEQPPRQPTTLALDGGDSPRLPGFSTPEGFTPAEQGSTPAPRQ